MMEGKRLRMTSYMVSVLQFCSGMALSLKATGKKSAGQRYCLREAQVREEAIPDGLIRRTWQVRDERTTGDWWACVHITS